MTGTVNECSSNFDMIFVSISLISDLIGIDQNVTVDDRVIGSKPSPLIIWAELSLMARYKTANARKKHEWLFHPFELSESCYKYKPLRLTEKISRAGQILIEKSLEWGRKVTCLSPDKNY